MNYCDFDKIFKQLRKSHNMTQQALGAKVGLSKAVVSNYENGIGYPSLDTLIDIAKFFNVTTDFLLGVKTGRTIDVSDLSDNQIDIIYRTIEEFRTLNKSS